MDADERTTGDVEGAADEQAAHTCDRLTLRAYARTHCALAASGFGSGQLISADPHLSGAPRAPHVPSSACGNCGTLHDTQREANSAHRSLREPRGFR